MNSETKIRAGLSVPRRRAVPGALGALLLTSSALPLAGCLPAEVVYIPVSYGAITTVAAGLGAVGILAADPATGPRAIFRNDADVPVQIRYWVGRMDVTAPNGVADLRSPDDHAAIVEPGETHTVRVGDRPGYNSAGADVVVWVRLDPADQVILPEGEVELLWEGSDEPQWFEITRPRPFAWRVVGTAGDLRAERLGEGALAPLPTELWIPGNLGELPVYVLEGVQQGDQQGALEGAEQDAGVSDVG